MTFRELFGGCRPVIGMVHLAPLPGSQGYDGDLLRVRHRAVEDARRLADGGCDAVLVENTHDTPYVRGQVGPETVAAMTWITAGVVDAVVIPVGVNVLRNDARAAVAIATVAEARFVRVSVHVGVVIGDQGLIEGRAAETLRYRGALRSDVAIFADIMLRPGNPLADREGVQAAHDAYFRGLANALTLTTDTPGVPCEQRSVKAVRDALPEAPLLAASGVTPGNLVAFLERVDGVVVDTFFHEEDALDRPIDPVRVQTLCDLAKSCP